MTAPVLHSWSFIHDILNYSTAVFWFLAYGAILQKVHKERNAYGLSFQTLFALVVVEASNVLLIVSLLSYHRKGFNADFFLVDCTSALISICVFAYLYRNFWSTYEKQRDTFGQKYLRLLKFPSCGSSSHVCFLYILAFVVSFSMFLLRRSPHAPSFGDVARYGNSRMYVGMLLSLWECFNDSVLALALLPQLFMFYNKRPRRVTNLLGTFVALLFCARILAFIYWCVVETTQMRSGRHCKVKYSAVHCS